MKREQRKLTQAEAMKLISKLARTERFPDDALDISTLATTLIEAAPDLDLARKTVEELRRNCTFCPSDAQIFETAKRLSGPDMREWKPMGSCPHGKCDGSGFVIVTRNGIDGAARCSCSSVAAGVSR